MGDCFIFAAGTLYEGWPHPRQGEDYVIAADGGYRSCLAAGLQPDLVLGDFDSMAEPDFPNCLRSPVEKDDTDTSLAMKKGLELGYQRFHICGGTGGVRLDHTIANLQMLLWLRRQGARGWLYDNRFVYTAVENESLVVPRTVEWGLLSLFCLGEPARGITLEGVQYPLRGASLDALFPLGVSNHILDREARITVEQGMLLVGWERQPL